MKKFISLLMIMFVISILGGMLFPPKTKVNIKVNVHKEEVEIPKNGIWRDIEKYTNRKAVDF